MARVLDGIRIVEVAQYVFVPVSSGVLAEWGADVIKVEHPTRGDAYRGLRRTGNQLTAGKVNFAWEHANRGKRSIGIDLTEPAGRTVLGKLLATADVLITNLLPDSRKRLKLELEDVRRDNPNLIYARGTALGERGPERERGGYDHATFWARTGAQWGATPEDATRPAPMPSGAFGDSAAGLALAGGIAAALLARERTGKPTTVDLSLLGMGMWSMASAISGAMMNEEPATPMPRIPAFNPLAGTYRTQEGRYIALGLLQGFHQWPMLCDALDHKEWRTDDRFSRAAAYESHLHEVADLLTACFESHDLAHWRVALASLNAVWEVVQDTLEVATDPQALANGYVRELRSGNDDPFRLVASPIQFGEAPNATRPAPEAGEHTEAILAEVGIGWEEIAELKSKGAIN
jgi:crotonobetainyl-CoA:carnitine CoA-transferase CaiB-like acyl-CoA transferase